MLPPRTGSFTLLAIVAPPVCWPLSAQTLIDEKTTCSKFSCRQACIKTTFLGSVSASRAVASSGSFELLIQLENDAVALVIRDCNEKKHRLVTLSRILGPLTERNEPEEGVVAQDARQVLAEALVVWHLCVEGGVLLAALLTELNRCEGARDQVKVESHESRDNEG